MMKLGNEEFGKVFLGDEFVTSMYHGEDQIYSIYKEPKNAEIVFRPTDNREQLSVSDPYFDKAKMYSIKGKSLVWNQLVENIIPNATLMPGYTTSTDGAYPVWTWANATNIPRIYIGSATNRSQVIIGHKYVVRIKINTFSGITPSDSDFYIAVFGNRSFLCYLSDFVEGASFSRVVEINSTTGNDMQLYQQQSLGGSIEAGGQMSIGINLIDLTLMFGTGNEPSTVEEFEAMFSNNYYPHNPGKIISNDASSLITTGFNQWDEEWEVGAITSDTGVNMGSSTQIRSKNFIPVIPGQTYYLHSNLYIVCAYDANKQFIRRYKYSESVINRTIDSDVSYIRFCSLSNYGTTYKNDICINISDPAKNGTYEPYKHADLHLELDTIKIKSHNIWDEEAEQGSYNYDNGVKIGNLSKIRNRNLIPVIPDEKYYYKSPVDCNWFLYGEDGSTLVGVWAGSGGVDFDIDHPKGTSTIIWRMNTDKIIPSDAYYIAFSTFGDSYTDPAQLDGQFCINLSDPNFNGQYEPYALRGGLKGAGTAYDFGRVEDDGYIHKVTKVMSEVDLGTLDWDNISDPERHIFRFELNQLKEGMPKNNDSYIIPNSICERYTVMAWGPLSASNDKCYSYGVSSGRASFINLSYSSTSDFKAAISGVKLIYELAEPLIYDLDEPIPGYFFVDKSGTEQATFPSHADSTPSTPFCVEIGYSK